MSDRGRVVPASPLIRLVHVRSAVGPLRANGQGQAAWAGGPRWVASKAPSQASPGPVLGEVPGDGVTSAAGWSAGQADQFGTDGRAAGHGVSGRGQGAQRPGECVGGGGQLGPGGIGGEVAGG
jgi:hypothetical protein